MPTAHSRVGLVVDDTVDAALTVLRGRESAARETAGLVRRAVLDGAAFEAFLRQVERTPDLDVPRLCADVRHVLELAAIPRDVTAGVLADLDRIERTHAAGFRRLRQFELLAMPPSEAAVALELAEELDEDDAV